MAFSVKGGHYFDVLHKSLVMDTIRKWLSGQERDDRSLQEALNDLEDVCGEFSAIRTIGDDIRFAITLQDWEEREGYLEMIKPRVKEVLKIDC